MAWRSSGSGSNDRAFVSSRSMELVTETAAAAAAAIAFFLAFFVLVDGSPSLAFAARLGAAAAAAGGGGCTARLEAFEVDAPSLSTGASATTTAGFFGGFLARIRKLGSASSCSPVL